MTTPLKSIVRHSRAGIAVAVLAMGGMLAGFAAPEPQPVPTRWEFDFREGPLRIGIVEVPGVGPQAYFYLTYRVTNRWGSNLLFAPDVELKLDSGELLKAGQNVPPIATESILERLDNPLFENQIQVVGNLLEGEENAKDGVLIWPATDLAPNSVTVFFAGLSGENTTVVVGRATDNPQRYVVRKSMMLRYETPGQIGNQNNEELSLAERRWIMR